MDPRHRMLLECTYEALENSGIPTNSIIESDVGVYVGGSLSHYELHSLRDFETAPRLHLWVRGLAPCEQNFLLFQPSRTERNHRYGLLIWPSCFACSMSKPPSWRNQPSHRWWLSSKSHVRDACVCLLFHIRRSPPFSLQVEHSSTVAAH